LNLIGRNADRLQAAETGERGHYLEHVVVDLQLPAREELRWALAYVCLLGVVSVSFPEVPLLMTVLVSVTVRVRGLVHVSVHAAVSV
jgi:hypothetical protein